MKFFYFFAIILCVKTFAFSTNIKINPDSLTKKTKVKNNRIKHIKEYTFKLNLNNNYKDIEDLKPYLEDKKIIFLGESFHRIKEYNQIKVKIIKYLVNELGFEIVLFESGLWESYITNYFKDSLSQSEILNNAIYPLWHTSHIKDLISFIKEKEIDFGGFDYQSTFTYGQSLTKKYFEKIDKPIANEILRADSLYGIYFGIISKIAVTRKHKVNKNNIFTRDSLKQVCNANYLNLIDSMCKIKYKFNDTIFYNSFMFNLKNKLNVINNLSKYFQFSYIKKHSLYRDEVMAYNFEYLVNNIYRDKKIIVWAHNSHIAKMPEYFNTIKLDQIYRIGLYMYSGRRTISLYGDSIINLKKPHPNSIEEIIHNSGYNITFVDFLRHTQKNKYNSWMFNKIPSFVSGTQKQKIIPKKCYEGVILINDVNPSELDNSWRQCIKE